MVLNSEDKNKTEITKKYLNLVENLQNFSENDDFFKHFQAMYFRLQAAISENQQQKKSCIENAENAEKHYKNLLTLAQIFSSEKNFAKAEDLCKQAELRCKNNAEKSVVFSIRAIIFLQQNKFTEAKNFAQTAIKLKNNAKISWKILKNIAAVLNDSKLAVLACENLLKLNPHDESSWTNFGERLRRDYQIQKSIQMTQIGMLYFPESANLWANLGTALHGDGRLEQAKLAYQKALALKPEFAEIANNLGAMAIAEKSWEEALKYFNIAINCKKTNDVAYMDMMQNKAVSLLELNADPEQIKAVAEQIRKANPRSENADIVYARLYNKLGDYYKSLEFYKKASQLNPNSAGIYFAIGGALKELHQFQEAEKYYQKSLEINPDNYGAVSGLLFTSHYFEYKTPQELFELAKHYGDLVQNHTDFVYDKWNIPNDNFPRENENFLPENHSKIKVGFTSGDFKNHPVGYFLEAVMQYLKSSNKLELFAYTTQNKEDDLTARIKPSFDHWIPVYGKSARMIAQQIHNDGIQILVDFSGHTGYNALPSFAYKPAPIQCSWLGWFATTGLKQMDYVIGDPIVSPPSEKAVLLEDIWNLPHCFYHFTPPPDVETNPLLQVNSEPPCIKNGFFTFGNFNNLSKLNDSVIKLWADILKAVPNSKLLMKYKQLADKGQRKRIEEWFEKFGVSPEQLLEPPSPRYELLNTYNRVDLSLDPFPYHGTTTSAESIMMGVPVLTLKGYSYLTRIGESTMINCDLPEFIAQTKDEYFQKALDLTKPNGIEKLKYLRQNLRQNVRKNAIFNPEIFANEVVEMFVKMWQKYLEKIKTN